MTEERPATPSGLSASEPRARETRANLVERECANHPGRMTLVSCSACGKPLCPECMVYSAVGIKCAECARLPRSARVTLKRGRLIKALAAAVLVGTITGFIYYVILGVIGYFFLFFFVAAGIGYVVGEAVARAGGHYRGLQTALVAVAGTVWAFVIPPLVVALLSSGLSWNTVVFSLSGRGVINWVVMAIAGYLAWSRNR